ncbi:hypothetical protein L211DRAFT_844337 [Terfezia boudieri ATCC MYA-4762]|uniref:Uncharacterized protein n=1 Tax=Terfezia boudieri ATCC MYA-4762 TaxID=1051890 RepID=A0A3N4M689_9PEZI|nr:hypothetical protein L211DRAFT_844337 [Terfezia boudieri ATCC MYA-4762]
MSFEFRLGWNSVTKLTPPYGAQLVMALYIQAVDFTDLISKLFLVPHTVLTIFQNPKMMPAGGKPTSTSISENPTSEDPTSENPTSENQTSENPTSLPPESQWRKEWRPPGKLGYEDYAKSMGLQTSAYKRLCKLARDCMKDVPAAVMTSRWDYVEETTKATCYLNIHKRGQEADIAIRRDFGTYVLSALLL